MNDRIRNPHPFDMSNYLQGLTYEVGGSDSETKEKDIKKNKKEDQKDDSYKLDWSFLHKNLPPRKRT
jgi:hypothetical protein